jgi:hypothetical protein
MNARSPRSGRGTTQRHFLTKPEICPSRGIEPRTWRWYSEALTIRLEEGHVYKKGNCRCFGSDRAPRVTPQGAFRSRTVLPTVARWFVLGAREIIDNDVQVRAALRCVTPYVLARMLYAMSYKGAL